MTGSVLGASCRYGQRGSSVLFLGDEDFDYCSVLDRILYLFLKFIFVLLLCSC